MRIDPKKGFGERECPSCATPVAANHNRCPICGYEFPAVLPAGRVLRWGAAILMLILLISLLLAW